MDYFKLQLGTSITLTVYFDGRKSSQTLTTQQIITMLGLKRVTYNGEVSLFCLAYEVFSTMSEKDLLIFLDYSDEDWAYYWQFIKEKYYNPPPVVVNCRKN